MEISLPMLPSGISLNSRVHWAMRWTRKTGQLVKWESCS